MVAAMAGTTIAEQNQTAGINSDFLPGVKAASSDDPVGPPKNPLVGGEDCATATVIPSLPYLDSGTTTGAVHDYDETCPYSGGTAGDVVYAYTPATDEAVDITVCSNGGDANYDTKIYVYEGIASCGVTNFDCNDDACTAPSYGSPYNSELMGLALTAGNTYFIVVDGYGTSEGDYTLSVDVGVPPPSGPGCGDIGDPGFLLGQDTIGPDGAISAATSGQATWGSYVEAETIAQAADPDWFDVGSLTVWGISALFDGSSWNVCDPTGMTFDVIFYEDNAGVPGTVICNVQSVVPTITNTGLVYLGAYDLLQFDLSAACDLGSIGTKWFSVQSETMTPDCSFMWVNAVSGDGQSLQDDGTGAWATATDADRSMCINGSTIPVELLSFDIE